MNRLCNWLLNLLGEGKKGKNDYIHTQNYNEISPHTGQNDYYPKNLQTINAGECGEKGTLLHCWWECKLIRPLWRTVCLHAQSCRSCLTLWHPMDCSPSGSSIHAILPARILEWGAIPSSRGCSQPRDRTHVFCVSWVAENSLLLSQKGSPWRAVCKFLKKLNIELNITQQSHYWAYTQKTSSKGHTYPNVHCSTTYNSQDMGAP